MARLEAISPDTMTSDQRAVHDRIVGGPRGKIAPPFQVMLNSPGFAGALEGVGVYLRYHSPLPAMLREFAILIVCRQWKAGYEWSSHQPLAAAEGLPKAALDAVIKQDPCLLNDQDALFGQIYDCVVALLNGGQLADELYDNLRGQFGDKGMTDLVGLVGYYQLLAMAINAHDVPPMPGTQLPWENNDL